MDIILKTENLNKKFKTTHALKDVSMTINRGDIYGFIGENGAGKSTLMRVITGINNATSGTFILNTTKRLGSIAAIVENPALYPNLNAMNNLIYQCDLLGIKVEPARLHELLTLVGLEEQINSKKITKNFSLGMKQRLSIAIALLGEPEFILLDEPMNGLDPVGIKDMRELIIKLNHENKTTFLISSHILSELDKVATVYGFISHGVLLEEISARDLHAKAGVFSSITLKEALNAENKGLLAGITYKEASPTLLQFEDEKMAQEAFTRLVKADVSVQNFDVVRETIEDYYLKVIKKGIGK